MTIAAPPDFSGFLPPGTRLHEYEVERVLGHGGFGITYLAFDAHLEKRVAIKEYLPTDLAFRAGDTGVRMRSASDQEAFQWGLDQFIKEARTLARFSHPAVVQIHRYFAANSTAYFVMDYAEGETLGARLKRQSALGEEDLRGVLMPVLDGLQEVHRAGVLHRDIKPENVILRRDGSPVLIDFGAARQTMGSKTRSVLTMATAGYAPLEQYSTTGMQGPWTDIYALGAVAYRALSGRKPIESINRLREDPLVPAVMVGQGRYSQALLEAVDWALCVNYEDRPQSLADWRLALTGAKPAPLRVAVPEPASLSRQVTQTPIEIDGTEAVHTGPSARIEVQDLQVTSLHAVRPHGAEAVAIPPRAAPEVTATAALERSALPWRGLTLGMGVLVVGLGAALLWFLQLRPEAAPIPATARTAPPAVVQTPVAQPQPQPAPPQEAPVLATPSAQAEPEPEVQPEPEPQTSPTPAPTATAAAPAEPATEKPQATPAPSEPAKETAPAPIREEPRPAVEEPAKEVAKAPAASEPVKQAAPAQEPPKKLASAKPAPAPAPAKPKPGMIAVTRMAALSTFQDCKTCPVMTALPAGAFQMGSAGGANWEKPPHRVVLTRAIGIGRSEVTVAQWRACVQAGACSAAGLAGTRDPLPVVNVSWEEVRAYTVWLTRITGRRYRMPTEAEWEYAARAGTTTARFWGEDRRDQCLYANAADQSARRVLEAKAALADCSDGHAGLAPGASLKPNPFGLHDVTGNAWEWTLDCWSDSYSGAPGDGRAVDSRDCRRRVIRGGSWRTKPETLRSSNRGLSPQDHRSDDLGFRLAAE